jgi:CrcB protein
LRYLLVGLGGFLGANARYLLSDWAVRQFGPVFPWGTLIINVSGSFVVGFFLRLLTARLDTPIEYRLFFAVGFLGAYTTFSTFTYDTLTLIRERDYLLAAANLGGSIALGMAGVTLGWLAGRMF